MDRRRQLDDLLIDLCASLGIGLRRIRASAAAAAAERRVRPAAAAAMAGASFLHLWKRAARFPVCGFPPIVQLAGVICAHLANPKATGVLIFAHCLGVRTVSASRHPAFAGRVGLRSPFRHQTFVRSAQVRSRLLV